ncbi:MAG: AI-2E family transporter [Saprospiraceae bacterium]|nr:AI-2E family transporter [Saprospiraceae bacterium]
MLRLRTQIHPNTIRQLFFLALLIFMGFIILKELYFMLTAFLGAVTLYVILLYPKRILTIKYNWPAWIAALFLMAASVAIMILPVAYLTSAGVEILSPVIKNPEILTNAFDQIHIFMINQFGIDVFNPDNVSKLADQILPFTQKTLGSTMSVFGNILLMYLVLYFLLVQTRDVELWLKRTLPFKTANTKKVISEVRNLVYSNALGIPIVAIIQGIVAIIGYSIFGVKEFLLMGLLTAISSVIPIVGTMLVYLPLAIFQYSKYGVFSGVGIGIWGVAVIGSVDNIARFLVQKKLADVHPLITMLGVFMGVGLFGFMGIIFGPLLLSVFFMLTQIYINEFGKVDANNPHKDVSYDED